MLSIELRYTSFAEWGYGISDYSYDAEKQNTGERGSGRARGVGTNVRPFICCQFHDYEWLTMKLICIFLMRN